MLVRELVALMFLVCPRWARIIGVKRQRITVEATTAKAQRHLQIPSRKNSPVDAARRRTAAEHRPSSERLTRSRGSPDLAGAPSHLAASIGGNGRPRVCHNFLDHHDGVPSTTKPTEDDEGHAAERLFDRKAGESTWPPKVPAQANRRPRHGPRGRATLRRAAAGRLNTTRMTEGHGSHEVHCNLRRTLALNGGWCGRSGTRCRYRRGCRPLEGRSNP